MKTTVIALAMICAASAHAQPNRENKADINLERLRAITLLELVTVFVPIPGLPACIARAADYGETDIKGCLAKMNALDGPVRY